MEGKVFVDGSRVTKPGTIVRDDADLSLKETGIPFVSRGGLKLDAALDYFALSVANKIALDVGASSGGFTDCLLKRGARKVYCVDVGYGQLAWSLRRDPRVVVLERTNIRHLARMVEEDDPWVRGPAFDDLKMGRIDLATVDVSFISLTLVIPEVVKFLNARSDIIALVKPQFEVGRGEVGKGGVVRDEQKRISAVRKVREELERVGLRAVNVFESPVPGQKGNIEYFIFLTREDYGAR